jgi:long-chain fatty acid transport protein
MSAGAVFGAGFGLYEASARGNAMGGGIVGSTGDASANYYNPANLTECTNISVTVGLSLINPFADAIVDGVQQPKMNAGWFPPPHAYVAVPLMKDLVFGFGTYCEYGLGTKYDDNWMLKGDTTETTIQQFTFNPNLAYKLTDWWSVAFGARMSYLTFENYKTPLDMDLGYGHLDPMLGHQYLRSHLKGDDFNCGWVIGTQFKLTEDLKLGAVYRSRIRHDVEGDYEANRAGNFGYGNSVAEGDAGAKLVLPSSATVGLNYDITKKFRAGAALTWTEWSTIDTIKFDLPNPPGDNHLGLNWQDAWRVGFGFEYDFTDDFCGRIGYNFDMDPSHKNHGTTMLPPGDRHIVGFGIGYKLLDNLRIDLGYNFIIMESTTRMLEAHNPSTGGEKMYKFQTDNAYSHIASASITYTF